MDIPEEITFQLKKHIHYSYEGEEIFGKFIILYSPTKKQMKECVFLKQAFFRAANSIKSDGTEDKDQTQEIKGQDIISLLYSSDADMHKVLLSGIALLKSGAAKIEGVKDMTSPMIEEMGHDDLENIIGEYIANFIVASLMNENN